MKITIGLVSAVSGNKKAVSKEFPSLKEAEDGLQKMIYDLMNIGWMPTYVLQDGIQRMKKLGDSYEITLK